MRDKEKAAAPAGHNGNQVTGISRPAGRRCDAMRLSSRSGDAIITASRSVRPSTNPPSPKARRSEAPPTVENGAELLRFPSKSKEGEGVSELQTNALPTCYRLPLPLESSRSAYPSGYAGSASTTTRCDDGVGWCSWFVWTVCRHPRHHDCYHHRTSASCCAVLSMTDWDCSLLEYTAHWP